MTEDKIKSIINLKLLDLKQARAKLSKKNNTSSKRVLNGKRRVLIEILQTIEKQT